MAENHFRNDLEYAMEQDEKDPLREFRKKFYFPVEKNEKEEKIYLSGNSLGLQPKSVKHHVDQELEDWARFGVEGHVEGKNPWAYYHNRFNAPLAEILGCKPAEVAVMNSLTVNLHLLMVSFYRPAKTRYKIILEAGAFSSDQYAIESQVRYHGLEPADAVLEVAPHPGEYYIREEDILSAIREAGDSLALVMLGGVNYYTGQLFNMEKITTATHGVGAVAGYDLAHAIGNVPLQLHNWNADFATWCSYKYLNSGPGGVSGIYIHERHGNDSAVPRFAGWWGYRADTRFQMKKGFVAEPGAAGWHLSNVPILSMAAHMASLEIFGDAGMSALRIKSKHLTGFMEFLLHPDNNPGFEGIYKIITPSDPEERGAQLSFLFREHGKAVFEELQRNHVVADWRNPDVIRVAPAPLYNSYEDVFRFAEIFRKALKQQQ
ncbi:MAG: kynureninase [Bacteroidia bacterium]